MLILTRKVEEKIIFLYEDIEVVIEVKDIHENRISIGIDAPEEIKIIRGELLITDHPF